MKHSASNLVIVSKAAFILPLVMMHNSMVTHSHLPHDGFFN